MEFLVHYDLNRTRAFGIWWFDGSEMRSLYSDPTSGYAARGRLIVLNKDNPDVSWADWCQHLANQAPYFEEWTVYDPMGMTPDEMLGALQRPEAIAG